METRGWIATAYALLNSGFFQSIHGTLVSAEEQAALKFADSPEVEIQRVVIVPNKDYAELKQQGDMEILKCKHHCPECNAPCLKDAGHAEEGYSGISGLCWCEPCQGWFIAGEPTLLRNRNPISSLGAK